MVGKTLLLTQTSPGQELGGLRGVLSYGWGNTQGEESGHRAMGRRRRMRGDSVATLTCVSRGEGSREGGQPRAGPTYSVKRSREPRRVIINPELCRSLGSEAEPEGPSATCQAPGKSAPGDA